MRSNLCWALALGAALMIGACDDDDNQMVDVSDIDPSFVKSAMGANLGEVELGRIADSISTTPTVKEYGQMMMTDHTQAAEELRSLAANKSVSVSDQFYEAHGTLRGQFRTMTGTTFDTAYLASQIQGHLNNIALFQWEADNGKDQDVKAYANKYLPKLQEHLARAQELRAAITGK